MNKTSLLLLLGILWILPKVILAQEPISINGYIRDAENGENLLQTSISEIEARSGTYSNEYGFYSLTLPAGLYTIKVSYLGFETLEQEMEGLFRASLKSYDRLLQFLELR